MAAVEQSMENLNQKLDTLKIDAQTKSGDITEVPVGKEVSKLSNLSRPFKYRDFSPANGGVPTSNASAGATTVSGTKVEIVAPVAAAAANGFLSPQGTFYAGCPSPVLNMPGYPPYIMDGVHFHYPAMDYGFVSQSVGGPIPAGIQFPHGTDGYVYGPQGFSYPVQYPAHPYYQQAPPGGQYMFTPAGYPSGGVMMLESQDPCQPAIVVSNGLTSYNTFGGPMPGFPVTVLPSHAPSENGHVPVSVSYPASHGVRVSAPAWIEPARKPKGWQGSGNHVGVQATPPAAGATPTGPVQIYKGPAAPNHTTSNGTLVKPDLEASRDHKSDPSDNGTALNKDTKANGVAVDVNKQPGVQQAKGAGTGSVVDTQVHSEVSIEHSKDTWASRVKNQQILPIPKQQPKGQNGSPNKDVSSPPQANEDEYNKSDFVTKYDDAKYFIIKSYSEENVHRSIVHNVWASTPNGNKKLDEAYQDAQRRAGGRPRGCPVFLFFSVNGSRQFCGVAEMIGPVDYSKSMDFWEQHKWSGSFPIKWHFIKDVPNSQFRRIILENNENKPVTNSRDTQEVNFQQGSEMLNIFKNYPGKASILDEYPEQLNTQRVFLDTKQQLWVPPQRYQKVFDCVVKERERDEGDGTKIGKPILTSSKTCDGGPKESNGQERPEPKAFQGKVLEPLSQAVRLEKENIVKKIPKKEDNILVPA